VVLDTLLDLRRQSQGLLRKCG